MSIVFHMAVRSSLNVSLTPELDRFVQRERSILRGSVERKEECFNQEQPRDHFANERHKP